MLYPFIVSASLMGTWLVLKTTLKSHWDKAGNDICNDLCVILLQFYHSKFWFFFLVMWTAMLFGVDFGYNGGLVPRERGHASCRGAGP